MILLDENFPADQAVMLRQWRVQCRQIGRDVSRIGVQDRDILALLHRLKRVTLFTQDQDFFKPRLCHSAYCLVWLDVKPGDAAFYLRRFLRHPAFGSHADRKGFVVRANAERLQYWRCNRPGKNSLPWPD